LLLLKQLAIDLGVSNFSKKEKKLGVYMYNMGLHCFWGENETG